MATFTQYEKKNGKKAWMFKGYLGTNYITGEEIRTTRRGFSTRRAAQQKFNELKNDFNNGDYSPNKNKDMKFSELYDLWFDVYKTTVKENTWIQTDRRIKKYILPKFGNMYIQRIDLKTAQKTVNSWAKQFGMYTKLLSYVKRVMDHGVMLELITDNPFRKIMIPTALDVSNQDKKLKFYTREQLGAFLTYLENRHNEIPDSQPVRQYYSELDMILFRVLAFSGLRIGELLALTWKDVDLVNNTITVNKTVSDTKKGFTITTPKTKNSYRTVDIDNVTIQKLKSWKLYQKKFFFKTNVQKNNLVITNYEGGYMRRNNVYNRSKRAADGAGLSRMGNHGFRHTYASLMFSAGINIKDVQERLGHASISMTLDIYTHMTKENHKITTELFEKYVGF
ncbi:tyrosine-type recombinase/integrase [Enterococcus olivae]